MVVGASSAFTPPSQLARIIAHPDAAATMMQVIAAGGGESGGGQTGPVELTGTPVEIVWASGSDPAAQNITIPSDATAVVVFVTLYIDATGEMVSSFTLNDVEVDENNHSEIGTDDSGLQGTSVSVWYNPSTGVQSLNPAWTDTPDEGPVCIVAFIKGVDTTGWRDVGHDQGFDDAEETVTIDTDTTDLVLRFEQRYSSLPDLESGWTSQQTTSNNSDTARLSTVNSPGAATTTANGQDEFYSTLTVVSFKEL